MGTGGNLGCHLAVPTRFQLLCFFHCFEMSADGLNEPDVVLLDRERKCLVFDIDRFRQSIEICVNTPEKMKCQGVPST